MSLNRISKKVADLVKSETMNKVIIAAIIVAILVFVSGSIYSLTAGDVLGLIFLRGGGIRVFIWTINRQTHA